MMCIHHPSVVAECFIYIKEGRRFINGEIEEAEMSYYDDKEILPICDPCYHKYLREAGIE